MCLLVSGKRSKVNIVPNRAITPAITKGIDDPNPTVRAEMAGPKTKPKPKAAPITANPFVRSLRSVVSEMTADTTGMLPAVSPSKALAKKRKMALGAEAAIKKDKAVPTKDRTSMGFLPYLSDILPMIGVAKN